MSTLITLLLAGASLPAALAQEGQNDQGDEPALVVQNSQDAVAFIDQNGNAATCESYTLIAAEPASDDPILLAEDGWYVVQGQVNATKRIEVHGNAHLILCDNARLIAEKGIHSANESTLSIFGQAQHTGKLEATGDEQNAGIGGTVAIRGGTITAQAGAPKNQSPAAAIGHGSGWDGDSTIELYDAAMVRHGSQADGAGATISVATQRFSTERLTCRIARG